MLFKGQQQAGGSTYRHTPDLVELALAAHSVHQYASVIVFTSDHMSLRPWRDFLGPHNVVLLHSLEQAHTCLANVIKEREACQNSPWLIVIDGTYNTINILQCVLDSNLHQTRTDMIVCDAHCNRSSDIANTYQWTHHVFQTGFACLKAFRHNAAYRHKAALPDTKKSKLHKPHGLYWIQLDENGEFSPPLHFPVCFDVKRELEPNQALSCLAQKTEQSFMSKDDRTMMSVGL
jgi:hypothetical protein